MMRRSALTSLVLVLVLAVYSSRSFCKAFCPLGALLAPFNYISMWVLRRPVNECRACGLCRRACPMQGDPAGLIARDQPANRQAECIVCYECESACAPGRVERARQEEKV